MDVQAFLFLIPYGLSFFVALGTVLYAWRRRDINRSATYGWVSIAQAGYIFGYIMERLYTDLSAKLLWNDVQLIANVVWILAFALFAQRYTDRVLPRFERHLFIFLIPALVYIVLVMTGNSHDLVRHDIVLNLEFDTPDLSYTPAIATWLWTTYAFGISGIGFNTLTERFIHTPKVYRTQIGAVILGNTLPMVSALLAMAGVRLAGQHDATPLVIMIGQLIVIWGLSRYRLYEIMPVAWHTVIKQMSDPVFILDPIHNIVDMNPAAERITDTALADAQGKTVSAIIPSWQTLSAQFLPTQDIDTNVALRSNTKEQHYHLHITPLHSNKGRHSGYALVAHDITSLKTEQKELRDQSEILETQVNARTIELRVAAETADILNNELKREIEERRKVEESLRLSQERYELATAAGRIAIWEWDMHPDFVHVSTMLQDWIQTSEAEIGLKSDDWLNFIHPEDREYVENALLQYAHGEIQELNLQHRVLLQSGEIRWFDVRATLIYDAKGTPVRMIGTDADITESRALLDSLRKRDTALEAVNYVAEQLLRSVDWLQECDLLLAQLGEALNVDRALIITINQDAQGVFTADLTSEWCKPGLSPMIGQAQFHNADTSGYQHWYQQWQQGKPVYAHTRDLPVEEQRFERAMGIKTLLQMPVIVNGILWGTISFHHVFEERAWSNAEIEALNTVASMLGTAIERQKAQEAQQRYAERLRILQEIDRAILAAESAPNIAKAALTHIHNLVLCKRVSVLKFDYENNTTQLLATVTQGETSPVKPLEISLEVTRKAFPDIFKRHLFQATRANFEGLGGNSLLHKLLVFEGIQTVIMVPLILQNEVVGSLCLGSVDSNFYESLDLDAIHEITDQLAIALQQAWLFEQVTQHAEELEDRVLERTRELECLNEELKQLSTLKDEFVSNVSHELRTPIASLGLYHDLLTKRPDKLNTYVEALKRETTRLFSLVEDLLYLSRMDQEQVPVNLKRNDLNALIAEYVQDRSLLAEQKNLHMTLNQEPGLPQVMIDRSMLGQVVSVVMTNAFNYTPSEGSIHVSTQQTTKGGQLWAGFSISDTGPGIPLKEQEKLFSRFFRGNIAVETRVAGTGLGLAIAKEIVDRHKGCIEVESEGIPGLGTTFSIWLPAT